MLIKLIVCIILQKTPENKSFGDSNLKKLKYLKIKY